jgi:putative copper export protein
LKPDIRYVWIVNNFLHDMATGTWAACVLVIWMLAGRRTGMPPEAATALGEAMTAVFWLAVLALVIVSGTGGIRLAYWRRQAAPDELAQKRRALLIKHAAFLLVYGAGTFWLWTLVRGA